MVSAIGGSLAARSGSSSRRSGISARCPSRSTTPQPSPPPPRCPGCGRREVSGDTATSSSCGRPRPSASSARRSRSWRCRSSPSSSSTQSAFEVAALGVVQFAPFILFTLPAGVWVDRLPRRPILIAGDFGRAALLATIPIAYIADVLTLAQLFVVGFLVGICTVFFDVAYQSYLPALVERDRIIEGNSKLEISRSAAQIGGPGLSGGLVELFTAPYAILVDAISFLGSGLFLLRIRKRRSHRSRRPRTEPGRACGRSSARAFASSSGTPTFVPRRAARAPRTSSRTSRSRSSSCTSCEGSGCRPESSGSSSRWEAPARSLPRSPPCASRGASGSGRRPSPSGLSLGAFVAAGRIRAGRKRRDPVPRGRRVRERLRNRGLQHRPGQLPTGDLPAEAPGPDELGHALHRLGDDPARWPRRRCARPRGSACARPSSWVPSAGAWPCSGSSSRHSGISARCRSRSTTACRSPRPRRALRVTGQCPSSPRSRRGSRELDPARVSSAPIERAGDRPTSPR